MSTIHAVPMLLPTPHPALLPAFRPTLCGSGRAAESSVPGSANILSAASNACVLQATCELCPSPAAVLCFADRAYLCPACDDAVHSANLIVRRHSRATLCRACGQLTGVSLGGIADAASASIAASPSLSEEAGYRKRPLGRNGVGDFAAEIAADPRSALPLCQSRSSLCFPCFAGLAEHADADRIIAGRGHCPRNDSALQGKATAASSGLESSSLSRGSGGSAADTCIRSTISSSGSNGTSSVSNGKGGYCCQSKGGDGDSTATAFACGDENGSNNVRGPSLSTSAASASERRACRRPPRPRPSQTLLFYHSLALGLASAPCVIDNGAVGTGDGSSAAGLAPASDHHQPRRQRQAQQQQQQQMPHQYHLQQEHLDQGQPPEEHGVSRKALAWASQISTERSRLTGVVSASSSREGSEQQRGQRKRSWLEFGGWSTDQVSAKRHAAGVAAAAAAPTAWAPGHEPRHGDARDEKSLSCSGEDWCGSRSEIARAFGLQGYDHCTFSRQSACSASVPTVSAAAAAAAAPAPPTRASNSFSAEDLQLRLGGNGNHCSRLGSLDREAKRAAGGAGADTSESPAGLAEQMNRRPPLGPAAADRLHRVLRSWWSSLRLGTKSESVRPPTLDLSFHLFETVLSKLQPGTVAASFLRATLAACLWTAMKLLERRDGDRVPGAVKMGAVTGATAREIKAAELKLMGLLNWRPLEGWHGGPGACDESG